MTTDAKPPTAEDLAAIKQQLEQLTASNQTLQTENDDMRGKMRASALESLPADQRPAFQDRMAIEVERDANAKEREQLNSAVRLLRARELAMQTHLPVEEFTKFDSLAEMDKFAMDRVLDSLKNPAVAKIITADPNAPPEAEVPAAGATAVPAGTEGAAGATQPLTDDPAKELLDDKEHGRGSGDLETFLTQHSRVVAFEEVAVGGQAPAAPPAPQITTAPPAAAPAAPATEPNPAAAAPAAQPAPAGVPAQTP